MRCGAAARRSGLIHRTRQEPTTVTGSTIAISESHGNLDRAVREGIAGARAATRSYRWPISFGEPDRLGGKHLRRGRFRMSSSPLTAPRLLSIEREADIGARFRAAGG
jgi:hypothetical protein